MASTEEQNIMIDRDYVDSFSIKNFGINEVMPKFFPDEEPSNLQAGMMGILAEYVSTTAEDAFNTGSSLVAEAFPSRARMESSIYSHAAIFQLTDAFADAGRCNFFIVLSEADIRSNFIEKPGHSYRYFYIGRDTVIYIKGIPFTLDYDIEIRAMYRRSKKKWIYSAQYVFGDYKNSISDVRNPYIKLQQTKTGILALQVCLRQYERVEKYEPIIDNATLNYPTIKVPIDGKLLGFDVLYRGADEEEFRTQLEPRVIYSLPTKEPFCYYKKTSTNELELSFTTKDAYFQPEFNSELKIIIYTTKGDDGNFPAYVGTEIDITKSTEYSYPNSWIISTKPFGACKGGKEIMDIEGLRELSVEGYTTANSLTTENDLQVYFNNYKHRYNDEVLFLKKRNDAVELLFSAFMFIKNDDYMYPTNTLTLDTNIQYFDFKEGGVYTLDPGYLFGYKGDDVYFIPVFYMIVGGDGEKYDKEGNYYDLDENVVPEAKITKHELAKKIKAGFVEETDHSYWKLVGDEGGDKYHFFLSNGQEDEETPPISQDQLFQLFSEGKVSYGTLDMFHKEIDFLIDIKKDAEARTDYVHYYETYKEENTAPDLTFDEYLFQYTFKDYKRDKGIDSRRTIFNTDVEEYAKTQDFMFTNPFILTVEKNSGICSYYQSFIANSTALDFVNSNNADAFVQFVTYTFHVNRDISQEKRYNIRITLLPSVPFNDSGLEHGYCTMLYDELNPKLFILPDDPEISDDPSDPLPEIVFPEGYTPCLENFNKELLAFNDLRVILTFYDEDTLLGYVEMIPTEFDEDSEEYTFEINLHTDDYISNTNRIRLTHICPYCGHEILNSANANLENRNYYCDACGKLFKEGVINIRESDSFLVPINNLKVELTILHRDLEITNGATNNPFAQYDKTYEGYVWTNVYNSYSERITLIQPLPMMRSAVIYKDFFNTGVDALDCTISDIPLMKYSILAYKDPDSKTNNSLLFDDVGKFQYFMDAFLDNYAIMREAKIYLNGPNIDCKFYNTYGRSTNFFIGDGDQRQLLDTNNIAIYFDIYVLSNTDIYTADRELKTFIKAYIETINKDGTNNFYTSNLVREIENNFAYVTHVRFKGINNYNCSFWSVVNEKIKLEDLKKEERRKFVPDLLVINTNNIYLMFHEEDED